MEGLQPTLGVLVKLASLAVHIEEWTGPNGHKADKAAIDSLLSDPEVREWLAVMDAAALIPKKR